MPRVRLSQAKTFFLAQMSEFFSYNLQNSLVFNALNLYKKKYLMSDLYCKNFLEIYSQNF